MLSAMWAGQKIVAILQEMITDLGTREKMFTSMLAKAEALIALGELDEARTLLNEKLTYFEYNAAMRHLLGQISLLEGDARSAAKLYGEAWILEPENTLLLEELAWVQYDADLFAECADSVLAAEKWSKN